MARRQQKHRKRAFVAYFGNRGLLSGGENQRGQVGSYWHLLLWPRGDDDLPVFMRWVTLTHVQRYHTSHATIGMGHLYQGRYKSFPVQDDLHYLRVLRYIEANPLRAGLVAKADLWPWSSFAVRRGRESAVALTAGPVDLPSNWVRLVHELLGPTSTQAIGNSIRRGSPFGDARWAMATAQRLLTPLIPPCRGYVTARMDREERT